MGYLPLLQTSAMSQLCEAVLGVFSSACVRGYLLALGSYAFIFMFTSSAPIAELNQRGAAEAELTAMMIFLQFGKMCSYFKQGWYILLLQSSAFQLFMQKGLWA